MTGSDTIDVTSACAYVRSCLGERPAVTCVAERGTLALDGFVEDSSSFWQPETSSPAPFKVYGGRVEGIPVLVVTETPPFVSARFRTFPVRLAAQCGCDTVILAATAIPLDPQWHVGGIMVVEDHINLLGDSPLIGGADSSSIPFADMGNAYDRTLQDAAMGAADLERLVVTKGVFVASPLAQSHDSEALETLREAGGDACGTGIVPHALAARDASLTVLALGALTGPDATSTAPVSSSAGKKGSDGPAAGLSSIVRRLIRDRFGAISGDSAHLVQSSSTDPRREE